MFNPDCPDCSTDTCSINDFTYVVTDTNTIEEPIDIRPDVNLLGRNYIPDVRDNNYLIKNHFEYLLQVYNKKPPVRPTPVKPSPIKPTPTPSPIFVTKYWDSDGWWGNQGNKPHCVGFSWAHWIEDGPIGHGGVPPIISPVIIYNQAQKIDEWPGENYAGTSVRAGAKYLKSINAIQSYYWAYDLNTLVDCIFKLGPVVVGTYWYSGMFSPDGNGLIRASGGIVGGHAYVINGVDKTKQLFRIKNSWGKSWGKQGHAFISFSDMSRLISMNGEICIAVENNF